MNDYIRDSIVEYAWHQFLYGYNGDERSFFLKGMIERFPVKLDSEEPAAIYIDDFSLPVASILEKCNNYQIMAVAREYNSVVLTSAIVEQTLKQIEIDKLNVRMKKFLYVINRLSLNPESSEISNIEELLDVLKESKKFYEVEYVKLLSTGEFQGDINSLRLGFIDLNMFIKYYKRALGMSKHFSIIIDYKGTGALVSLQAVNGIVTKRCADDLAMKISCEPQEWKTYYDLNGMLAEYVHDYSVVELDESNSNYIKKLKVDV